MTYRSAGFLLVILACGSVLRLTQSITPARGRAGPAWHDEHRSAPVAVPLVEFDALREGLVARQVVGVGDDDRPFDEGGASDDARVVHRIAVCRREQRSFDRIEGVEHGTQPWRPSASWLVRSSPPPSLSVSCLDCATIRRSSALRSCSRMRSMPIRLSSWNSASNCVTVNRASAAWQATRRIARLAGASATPPARSPLGDRAQPPQPRPWRP
jgi:hypothetical protein